MKEIDKFIEENRHFIEESMSFNEWDVIEVSDVKNFFITEQKKIEKDLFQAFLSGYDLGYEDGQNKIRTDDISNAVRYVRRNFNEDFKL